MPLYLPVTPAAHARRRGLGRVRPAHDANWRRIARRRQIQFQRGSRGAFKSIKTVRSPARAATLTSRSPSRQAARFGCSGRHQHVSHRTERLPLVNTPSNATPPTTTPAPQHRRRGARGRRRDGRLPSVARHHPRSGDVSGHVGLLADPVPGELRDAWGGSHPPLRPLAVFRSAAPLLESAQRIRCGGPRRLSSG